VDHFTWMVTYAALVSAFFALLWRRGTAPRVKLFAQMFLGMVAGGLVLGWLMYFFPSGPPAPIP
jgi:uncharacterized membrane protein YfcA